MGLLSVPPSRDDPKRQTGAYIALRGRLYQVLGPVTGTALLDVENCDTETRVNLSALDVTSAKLVRAAPALKVPDTIPELTP
jgi:hypothetical protein